MEGDTPGSIPVFLRSAKPGSCETLRREKVRLCWGWGPLPPPPGVTGSSHPTCRKLM